MAMNLDEHLQYRAHTRVGSNLYRFGPLNAEKMSGTNNELQCCMALTKRSVPIQLVIHFQHREQRTRRLISLHHLKYPVQDISRLLPITRSFFKHFTTHISKISPYIFWLGSGHPPLAPSLTENSIYDFENHLLTSTHIQV